MKFYSTHCCAIQEIDGLAAYQNRPKAAMLEWCKTNLDCRVKFKNSAGSFDEGYEGTIYSWYLFTARVLKADGKDSNYGQQFADFIAQNGLGAVWESPVRRNMLFHQSTYNRVWVWEPDLEKVRDWYKENKNVTEDRQQLGRR